MKQSKRTERSIGKVLPVLAAGVVLALMGNNTSQAYERYNDGCQACHGAFDGDVSPQGTVFPNGDKHRMHRNSNNMGTDCVLCHRSDDNDNPFIGSSDGDLPTLEGRGCSGCHVGSGLRKHHATTGTTTCYSGGASCHSTGPEMAPAENVSPYYYGKTAYTKANNPGNTALVANTNENWSVGDFLGLDNDGNNLYDLADYAVGPRDRILSSTREGNNMRVTWQTYGGRTNTVQAAGNVSGTYSGISPAITSTNVGPVTTNYLDAGGALNPRRFYRLSAQLP